MISRFVIPAKAGIHLNFFWIPAFAGMTESNISFILESMIPLEMKTETDCKYDNIKHYKILIKIR